MYSLAFATAQLIPILPVEKVIIAQEHVSRLINFLSPGAYRDLTKIDFGAMDRVDVKPLGLYGSKQEIARLLRDFGAVDEYTWVIYIGRIVTAQ